MFEFALPDVGEGLTEAEIVAWQVQPGDRVGINDVLVEIETAKSVVELPSPVAGTIAKLHGAEGETIAVGSNLVSINDGESLATKTAGPAVEPDKQKQTVAPEEQPLVLVGTGPTQAVPRRRRLRPPPDAASAPVPPGAVMSPQSGERPRAKPPVRLLAKRLGVDLATLVPSVDGVISRADVERASAHPAAEVPGGGTPPEFTRIPIKGVRKVTAAAMVRSAFTAPHVTEWLTVDVTRTMNMVQRIKSHRDWQGIRVNPLVFVARALLLAVRRYPAINAQWDEDSQEIVQYRHVNLGIAAATPRGLLVPNIKGADNLDVAGLADAMTQLVDSARSGRTTPEEMSSGTITITNIGALGVDAGTPILNPGEAAILAFGAVREMPWVVDGQIVPRMVTQLALSFDHRLVDGELGSQVLVEIGRLLADPGEAFLSA